MEIMITWGKWYWPAFLITSALWIIIAFGIPETIALLTRPMTHLDNTLTRYARDELNVSTTMTIHTVAWYLTLIVWIGVVIFLTGHIWFNLFNPISGKGNP